MTAVEWLIQQICGEHTEAWKEEIQQALELEKHQITSSYIQAKMEDYKKPYDMNYLNLLSEMEVKAEEHYKNYKK